MALLGQGASAYLGRFNEHPPLLSLCLAVTQKYLEDLDAFSRAIVIPHFHMLIRTTFYTRRDLKPFSLLAAEWGFARSPREAYNCPVECSTRLLFALTVDYR